MILTDPRTTVYRVSIERIKFQGIREEVFTFRVACESQDDCETLAAQYLTAWLKANPNEPGSYTVGWFTNADLGLA